MHEDDLDRAVDARIDSFAPATVPAFAALLARKRSRDRRRAVTGGAALSVSAVAVAVTLGAGLGGGPDRLDSPGGFAGPAATPTVGVSGISGPQRYSITYTDAQEYLRTNNVQDALVQECMRLPGTSEQGIAYSDPPQYGVTVTGLQAVEAFTRCIDAIDNVTLTSVGISRPGGVEPAQDAPTSPLRTFTVRVDSSSTRPDPAVFTAEVEACLALPGVTGSSVQESFPATYELSALGPAADTLARCLGDITAARVVERGVSVAQGAGLEAFIKECVGAETARSADEYHGLTEGEATRTKRPESADTITTSRVVGRDGECLFRTADFRSDRVNLLIADGKVVWAGRF